MPEHRSQELWVDWYLRDELSAEDEEAFETAMLESPALQQELETALAIRGALQKDSMPEHPSPGVSDPMPEKRMGGAAWRPLALAAAVALAVLSTVMWWKSGIESADLERRLQAHAQPRTDVLTVAVPIMRSASGQSPDVIVQKPAGQAAILLDIELGLQARQEPQLGFELTDSDGGQVLSWQASPASDGRATALINSEQIPASRLWLRISDGEGNLLERRLLEFRAPAGP